MKRFSRFILRNMAVSVRLVIVLVVCTFMLMGVSLPAHPAQVHITILVVVCEYANTETPELMSRQWADELNLGINTLYATATHQQAPEFEFVPVPSVLKLDVDYSSSVFIGGNDNDLVEDPGVIDREGVAALNYARQMVPEYFSEPVYLLSVANRAKASRARALFDFPLVSDLQGVVKVKASIAVLADPLANLRSGLSSSEMGPELVDTDGDGLSDEQETMLGTFPNRTDSDGDGYSD